MPDTDPSTQQNSRAPLTDNSDHKEQATPSFASLKERLKAEFEKQEAISFPKYLEVVLYDPSHGYYANQTRQVGRQGDFFTSVSVGPLFGEILAHRFLNWWNENGRPEQWRLLELGGHDGKLAADILGTLARISPHAWSALQYATIEPLPKLRSAQAERLAPLAADVKVCASSCALAETPLPGVIFGNEVLDALPFHLIRYIAGNWKELFVSKDLQWISKSIQDGSPLATKLADIAQTLPNAYQTEIRTNYGSFVKSITDCITTGLVVFIDYGFAAPEYYDIHRTEGTLRTFSQHKAADNPLDRPGEIDITAHVNFTDLALEMQKLGYQPTHFSNQGSYLTHLSAEMIRSGELNNAQKIAQFKTLTHPAHLGGSFHAIEFTQHGQPGPEVMHRLAIS